MLCSKCFVSIARLNNNFEIIVKRELFYDPYRKYDQVFQTMPINKLAVCSQVNSIQVATEHSGRQRTPSSVCGFIDCECCRLSELW